MGEHRYIHSIEKDETQLGRLTLDTRFLQGISVPNLEVRRHNILRDDLEKNEYDLAHCRYLLHHLSEPERALNRMAEAIRPGGWLLVEEDDYGSVMLCMDVNDPRVLSFTATQKALCDFLTERGIVNQYWGRRVRSLVDKLGFTDVGNEGWTCAVRGGDPITRVYERSFGQAVQTFMIPAGAATQEQADSILRLLRDPSFYFLGHTIFSAWGRKPVGQN